MYVFRPRRAAYGISVPWPESEPGPWQWTPWILTIRPPGSSQTSFKLPHSFQMTHRNHLQGSKKQCLFLVLLFLCRFWFSGKESFQILKGYIIFLYNVNIYKMYYMLIWLIRIKLQIQRKLLIKILIQNVNGQALPNWKTNGFITSKDLLENSLLKLYFLIVFHEKWML